MRERINLSVNTELYKELKALAHSYGFNSLCSMALTLLRLFAAYVKIKEQAAEQYEAEEDADIHASIENDFLEFTEWMRTPDGTVPKRKMRRDIEQM